MAYGDWYGVNNGGYSGMQEGHSMSEGPAFGKGVAVVNVTNVTDAENQVMELNRTSNIGAEATIKLGKIIESLKQCWQGSDAVVHINKLCNIKEWCGALSSTALEISSAAHSSILQMQQKAEANGGKPVSIGSLSVVSFGDSIKRSELAVDNGNTFVDPEMARGQLIELRTAREIFNDFSDKYLKIYNFMLEIWQSGGARDIIQGEIDKFTSGLGTLKDNFDQAINALDKAITNWEA